MTKITMYANSLRTVTELKRTGRPMTITRWNIEAVGETSWTWLQSTAQKIRLQTRERRRRKRRNPLPSSRDTDCCRVSSALRFARRGECFPENRSTVVLYRVSFRFRSRNGISFDIDRKEISYLSYILLYIVHNALSQFNK